MITCKNVTKSYRSHTVLDNINFAIREHTLTGVIGRNGVGKTTLLKMLVGFIQETEGELTILNETPFNNLTIAQNSIFIDDTMTFPQNMTLQDILHTYKGFYPQWDHKLALRLTTYFQLQLAVKPSILSKGKNSILRAIIGIAARCPLTLFDEPTNGMDAATRKDFYRALLKDYINHPRTILLSSHHLEEIENLLEDVLLIHNKEILFHDAITELQERYITITGHEQTLVNYCNRIDLIAAQKTGPYTTWTVQNDFTEKEILAMEANQIQISTVSANEAYIAMTTKTTGGIDDVFNYA